MPRACAGPADPGRNQNGYRDRAVDQYWHLRRGPAGCRRCLRHCHRRPVARCLGRHPAAEHPVRWPSQLLSHRESRGRPDHRPPDADRAGAGTRLPHRVLVASLSAAPSSSALCSTPGPLGKQGTPRHMPRRQPFKARQTQPGVIPEHFRRQPGALSKPRRARSNAGGRPHALARRSPDPGDPGSPARTRPWASWTRHPLRT
jgi:hypothetical protein